MFKKFSVSLLLLLTVLFWSAQPVSAAENMFQKSLNSFSNGVQRFYLRWVPGNKPGKAVMYQAIQSTQSLKTVDVTSDITANLFQGQQQQAALHLNIKSPTQLKSSNQGETPNQEFNVVADFSLRGTTLKTAADVKITPQTFYFKLVEVPTLPNVDLSSITGKWFKSDNAAASQSAELTAENKERLDTAFTRLMTSADVEQATADTKADKPVYVVNVKLPRAAVQEYVATVVEVQSQTKKDQPAAITVALQENLTKNLNKIGDVKVLFWVDRTNFHILHAESQIDYLVEKSAKPTTQTGPLAALSQVDQVKLKIVADFGNFNAPVAFVEPIEAQDSAELMTTTLNKVLSGGGSSVGTSELPVLTPYQQQQLQQLNSASPEQRQRFLEQISKTKLSTRSATPSVTTP